MFSNVFLIYPVLTDTELNVDLQDLKYHLKIRDVSNLKRVMGTGVYRL